RHFCLLQNDCKHTVGFAYTCVSEAFAYISLRPRFVAANLILQIVGATVVPRIPPSLFNNGQMRSISLVSRESGSFGSTRGLVFLLNESFDLISDSILQQVKRKDEHRFEAAVCTHSFDRRDSRAVSRAGTRAQRVSGGLF